jgi:hypothetical protein
MLRVLGIAAVVACSGTPPPAATQPAAPPRPAIVTDAALADAASLDQDLPRLIERSLAMYQDVAAAFAASGTDCAAAIARLGRLAGAYRDVVVANARVVHDGRAGQLRDALALHDEVFTAAAGEVMHSPTMAACAPDPVFTHALDDLFAPP